MQGGNDELWTAATLRTSNSGGDATQPPSPAMVAFRRDFLSGETFWRTVEMAMLTLVLFSPLRRRWLDSGVTTATNLRQASLVVVCVVLSSC
nr:hypothetical protein Iba_chr13bCG13410 [Ipomoea batatas]